MTENQKLREAIKRLLKAHRITVQAPPKTITDAENQIAEIQNAVNFAEEALALPTAVPNFHLGARITGGKLHATVMHAESDGGVTVIATAEMDAASLFDRDCAALMKAKTAAPVGEREAFESVIVDQCGSGAIKRWPNGRGESYENARVQDYRQGWLWCIEWQARSALSAGDAVDAQRWRYAMDWGTKDFAVCMRVGATGVYWEPIKTDGPIDTAMRKGQL